MFTLNRSRFTELVCKDKDLIARLIKVVDKLIESSTQDTILDFIQIHRTMEAADGTVLTGDEALRASAANKMLKNVVLQMIFKNRETRKVPKLKDILNNAIKREHKTQEAKRTA